MPDNNAELQVYFAHGLRAQVIPVGSAVDEVGVLEHRSATEEHLCDLFPHRADWSPRWTLNVVHSWGCRNVTVAIAVELTATK